MTAPLPIEPPEETRGPHWVSRSAFPIVVVIFFSNQLLLGLSVAHRWYWLAALLVLTASHLMHGLIIALHEASHGLLRPIRRLNDFDGFLLGTLSLMSFSLYRAAHQSHHAYLATEKDEELWPFVDTTMPRWRRLLAALLELNLGFFFTPFLFFRAFIRHGSPIRSPRVRRQVWRDYGLMAAFWIISLLLVGWFHLWNYFLWLYLVPGMIAGNLQSWRKYIEHVGMTGDTVNSSTRNIVANGPLGRLVSFTLLHEPFHGVHHRFSGIPHAELSSHVDVLQPTAPQELAPFPSYAVALVHLLRNLPDPRVGSQWLSKSGG